MLLQEVVTVLMVTSEAVFYELCIGKTMVKTAEEDSEDSGNDKSNESGED